ncbi:MAG TPA: hypothetical protein VN455_06585 [Methanotrichaceae archaeon]|nr:hypothetical protein [Methanotrichaceae archaeon]
MTREPIKVPIAFYTDCPQCGGTGDTPGWNHYGEENFIGMPDSCTYCRGKGRLTDEELAEAKRRHREANKEFYDLLDEIAKREAKRIGKALEKKA